MLHPPASARSGPPASARSGRSDGSGSSIRGRGFDKLHPTWSQAVVAAAADAAAAAAQSDSRSTDFSDHADKFELRMVDKQWSRVSDDLPFDLPPPPEEIHTFTPMYEDNYSEDDIPEEAPLTDLALHQIEYGFEADSVVQNGGHVQDQRDEEAIPAEASVIHPGTEQEQLPLFLAMQPLPVQPWLVEPDDGYHEHVSIISELEPTDDLNHNGNFHEPPSRNEGMNDVAKVWQHLPPLPLAQEDDFAAEIVSPTSRESAAFLRDNQTPLARENVVLQDVTRQQDEQFRDRHLGNTDAVYPTRIGQQGLLQQSGAWEAAIGDAARFVPPDSPCRSPRSPPQSPRRSPRSPPGRHGPKAEPTKLSGTSPRSALHLTKIEPLGETNGRTHLNGTGLVEPKQVELSLDRFREAKVESPYSGKKGNKLSSISETTLPSPSRSTNLQQLRASVKQEARDLLGIDMWPRCSSLCIPMWVPLMALVLTLVFLCGLAGLLWYGETPGIVPGAFGLITQIDTQSSLRYHFFSKAKEDAMSTFSGLDATETDEDGPEYMWRHVEVVFQMPGADLLHIDSLRMVWKAEAELRGLPGWQRLCLEEVPVDHRRFCDPGDSFVAVAFGSKSKAADAAASVGVLREVAFDGSGTALLMPVASFLKFLKHFNSDAYKRWLAQTDEDGNHLRTTFSFYLPKEDGGMWEKFVEEELEPKLAEQAERGDGPCGDAPDMDTDSDDREDGPKLRVFYRATGLNSKELTSAVQGDIQMSLAVASCGTFLPTFLATRRILLGITALLLAIAAPTIASALTATRGSQGMLEYPAIAVAPWFLIAICCTDLAVACTSTWELKSWSSHKGCQLAPCRCMRKCLTPLRRLGRFLAEVPMPAFAPVVMFLGLQGAMVDVPLVTEFAAHMGYGLLTAALFSSIIYPPAIELGDFLHRKLKHIRSLRNLRRNCRSLMPWELGGKLHHPDVILLISRTFAKMLGSKTVLCLVLITTAVVILLISLNAYSPSYHLMLPDLFDESHRLSKGPKIWTLFGEEQLMGKFAVPAETLQKARTCTPDAWESAECSWHKCEVDPTEKLAEGNCVCYENTPGAAQGCTSSMPATARFVGLDPGSDFYSRARFWEYAQEALKRPIVNGTVHAWEIGPVEMENWQTGRVTAATQVSASINRADGSITSWEDACFRALCYCNLRPCFLSRAWKFLGRFPVDSVGNGGRRMAVQPGGPHATVFVVWGMAPPEKVPSKIEAQSYVFTGDLSVRNPWAQRNILGLCEGTPPSLQVIARQCWAIDFRSWLFERGERYPVRSERFDALFMEFVVAAKAKSAELSAGVLPAEAERARAYRYFWFHRNGSMSGCFATFNVRTPSRENHRDILKYVYDWNWYMKKRNSLFNCVVKSWHACPLFASVEELMVLKNAAGLTLFSAFSSAALVVLALTFSFGLSLAILAVLALSLGCFAALCVYLGEDIGIIELLGLGTFMMILSVPMIRISLQYVLASSNIYDGTSIKESGSEEADLLTLVSRLPRSNTSTTTIGRGLAKATVETYLVDNRALKATSLGLGYRLSPRIADLDREADVEDSLAPWGSKVIGKAHGDDWIKVDHRFLPVRLHGICVLTLMEEASEDEFSSTTPTACCSCFSRAAFVRRADDIIKYVTGLSPHVQLWPGAPRTERLERLSAALAITFPSAFASSFASAIVGGGLLILRMKAFEVVGFAALCASVAAPVAALGLMSVLTIWGFGPTDAYRKALLDFARWVLDERGESRGHSDSPCSGDTELQGMIHGMSMAVKHQASDSQAAGETAARVLGFPFSLAVKTFSEHIYDMLPCRSRGQTKTENINTSRAASNHEQALTVLDDSMQAAAARHEAEVHTDTVVGEEHLVDDRSWSKRDGEKRGLDDEVRDLLAAARSPASGLRTPQQQLQQTYAPFQDWQGETGRGLRTPQQQLQQTYAPFQDFDPPELSTLFQAPPYREPAYGIQPSGPLRADMPWYAHQAPERGVAHQDEEVRELLAAARSPRRQRPPPLEFC